MSASAMPWLAAIGLVWIGAVVVLWAICRAAALADAEAEEQNARAARFDPALRTPHDIVAAATGWLDADESCLFAVGDPGSLYAIAADGSVDAGLLDVAEEALANGALVEVRLHESPLVMIAVPVGRAGALAVGIHRAGARVGFAQRRALLALSDAAAALPAMSAVRERVS